ncbi:helicase-related protein [Hyphomicrobium facile]|uniref:ATP-dependent RNA helicase SUPV3L1/SUV3 n=1 Tax=Hyphomicrobium facile TaxID=51670 RepID=A0A1I7NS09_9HYPH|nr:helicase-related protein [Hyphomicrobium facile]SFV37390.1 ATP-dependent RNA helicase SUPV3L1/SUV3 [Hyphomicrobium facile]
MASDLEARIRNVTAVLGPTNTGKTHLAIERMLGHESGMIGLPLRLLAREVYDKIKQRVGADKVALITGEEKIKPERARYWVSTVEAMPRDIDVDFLAIDEIQLCGDPERGHVFTDRLLHARGRSETLLLGAQTMREAISDLIPGANFISRPRLSKLTYSGEKKITRLPSRTAIVAFSAQEVYALAELIRRQRGGAAVVLGALSPRTRNAQVALYQSGDVEFLIATDAIGMGLNLDVDHVAFSALRKFDGYNHRNLTPAEIGQIAGRAGRHMNDGTFGVTGGADGLDADMVERLETHSFDSVKTLQWRNRELNFSSLDALHTSLRELPREQRLTRARTADDVAALEALSADREITDIATNRDRVALLWDVCQVPDYRKISGQSHAELVGNLYRHLTSGNNRIDEDWFSKQVSLADRTDGDIDTLANRIAHIRTWTFVANRPDWLGDPQHWQERTRAIEDSLSDALHECLTQRFVDRRTSALMKGMRDKDELTADIADDGAITVENHFVGRLKGFRFTLDAAGDGIHEKATRQAAMQVVTRELGMRARRVAAAQNEAFKLTRTGSIMWREDELAKLERSEDPLQPGLTLLADDAMSEADREKVQARLKTWLDDTIADKLKPLVEMSRSTELQGLARGIAFQLKEGLGALKRETVANEINALDQAARAELRKFGLRFGAFNIFFPLMLKPAPADLAATLWLLKNPTPAGTAPQLPRPGLTSVAVDPATPEALYRAHGFHLCGPRAIRLDILERLADLIRPLLAWRSGPGKTEAPPKGSTGDGGFRATDDMMSILGCSVDELSEVLKALGFRLERRPIVAAAPAPAPATETSASPEATTGGEAKPAETETEPEPELAAAEAPADEAATAAAVPSPAEEAEPAVATPSDTTQAAAAPEAEKFEEIWRPRRHQRPERRDGPPRREGGQNRHQRPHSNRPAAGVPHAASSATANSEAPASETPAGNDRAEHQRHRRPERQENRGERPRFEGRKGGGDRRPDQGGRKEDANRPRRDDNRNGRREERRSPQVITAAPPKSAAADSSSPFAALAALKAQMEKRSEGSGST